jgi:glycosyltransferase involved in cell wall biosynthesis
MTSISIVIPCLNAASTLPDTLASLAPQLTSGIEVILADGGSSDASRSIAEAAGFVRVLPGGDDSLYAGFVRGIRAASNQYLLFLNADDRLGESAIRSYAAVLATSPHAPMVTGWAIVEGDRRATLIPTSRLRPEAALFGIPAINARLFRRELFDRFTFDTAVGLAADRLLLFQLSSAGITGSAIDAIVYRYRAHTGSRTLGADSDSRRRAVAADVQLAKHLSRQQTDRVVSAWRTLQALRGLRWSVDRHGLFEPSSLPTALVLWRQYRAQMAGW